MALILCPECKREISDQAKTCPHCGFPIEESFKLKSSNWSPTVTPPPLPNLDHDNKNFTTGSSKTEKSFNFFNLFWIFLLIFIISVFFFNSSFEDNTTSESYSTNNNSNEKTKTSTSNTNEDIQNNKKRTKEEKSENAQLIEKDALIDDQLNQDQVKVVIAFIRLNDYKCDSVSSMAQTRDEKTIRVNCNNYKYKYYINDEGGKWTISLSN